MWLTKLVRTTIARTQGSVATITEGMATGFRLKSGKWPVIVLTRLNRKAVFSVC